MMPDADGPATFARLRPLLADGTPVIFLTAKGDTEPLLALGAAGVIAKPFDPIALPREVAAITAR
jgi:DNA-binding response OmpR family regulator